MRREIRQNGGYRRLDDERDQKEEGEDREDCRGAQAEGSIKLGLLDHGTDLGLLHLNPHYHRRFVRINDCSFLRATWTLLVIYSKVSWKMRTATIRVADSGIIRRDVLMVPLTIL